MHSFQCLLLLLFGYFIFKDTISNFFCSKAIGILTAIGFIVIFFYTYTGILGRNIAIIDISSFIIAVILGEFVSYKRIVSKKSCNNPIAIILLVILLFAFAKFTYLPPRIKLFQDPITGDYGVITK